MTYDELLTAVEGVPWLATGLLAMGGVGVVVERITGMAGPATKVVVWWAEREVRKLRRDARLRAEQRRIEQEEESGRVTALRAEVQWLRAEVARLRQEVRCTCTDTAPLPTARHAARNPAQVPVPRR